MQEQWQASVEWLSGHLSAPAHRIYIRPLRYLGFDGSTNVLRLGVPSLVKLKIVREQFAGTIDAAVQACFGGSITVEFETLGTGAGAESAPTNQPSSAPSALESTRVTTIDGSAANIESSDWPGSVPADFGTTADSIPSNRSLLARASSAGDRTSPANTGQRGSNGRMGSESGSGIGSLGARAPDDRTRLLPDVTFATFVTGKANELARAAASKVAERPGTAYNPLFIYGGVGLGKTHLMHAVGNAILERAPEASVRYVSANQFFQDMVQALRRETVDQFKNLYQSLDLLLIDDIQFLSGKQRSQEEFFYVFESLVADHRQILISSDTYPKEMSGLDDRLKSRFNSGLIAAIDPPELEMRVAILLRKAEQAGVRLPEDVAYFVAKHIRQNVRELEGALARIIHYAEFRQAPIETDLVKEALRDLLSYNRGQISIELIQRTVAEYYGIKVGDMGSSRRPARLVLPRQIAMYLAKELTQKSLPEIGEAFGGRDHTTVLYAVRKIQQERRHQTELNHKIHVLEQTLREYL